MDLDTAAVRRLRDHFLAVESMPETATGPLPAAYTEAVLRRAEPLAETMYLVMMADGQAGDEERRALAGALSVLTQGAVEGEAVGQMFDRFAERLAAVGAYGRLRELGLHLSARPEDRETAFSLGAMVALADDDVDGSESELVALLAEYYGVSDRRAEALLQALD